MAKVHEITVWARGVIMDKEGRDVINIFAKAAQMDGKFAQAFDNYEDLPDRVLVTVRKYVRLSDEEIEHKYVYTNDKPELVVIAEETIIKGIDILRGMEKGGTLIINSNRPIDDLLKFIPNAESARHDRHGGCQRHFRGQDRRFFRFGRRRGYVRYR